MPWRYLCTGAICFLSKSDNVANFQLTRNASDKSSDLVINSVLHFVKSIKVIIFLKGTSISIKARMTKLSISMSVNLGFGFVFVPILPFVMTLLASIDSSSSPMPSPFLSIVRMTVLIKATTASNVKARRL